ncbi:hypothetical protein BDW69DRAFT_192958 [Aspergillus filifer]
MTKIALFGSTGQIGRSILLAILNKSSHSVIQIVRPESKSKAEDVEITTEQKERLTTVALDPLNATVNDLTSTLQGVEIVISALNGPALEAQSNIQDAADKAGVRRFYPSEYGMHHIYTDENGYGHLHPTWNTKDTSNRAALHHPAIASGRMTYTLLGCGDFYNQDRERTWCPWTQVAVPHYKLHIVGDSSAKIDFTHIDDLASFVVQTIENPRVSENRCLNVVSDRISYDEIAALLERYSRKKVEKIFYPVRAMERAWRDPGDIPQEVKGKSAFPDDFWMLVKGMQGLGRFWRPPGEVHNDLFPELEVTTFEKYFKKRFAP